MGSLPLLAALAQIGFLSDGNGWLRIADDSHDSQIFLDTGTAQKNGSTFWFWESMVYEASHNYNNTVYDEILVRYKLTCPTRRIQLVTYVLKLKGMIIRSSNRNYGFIPLIPELGETAAAARFCDDGSPPQVERGP
jgi:hypothetical protein